MVGHRTGILRVAQVEPREITISGGERLSRLKGVGKRIQNVGRKGKQPTEEQTRRGLGQQRPMGVTEGNWAAKLKVDLEAV
jgi:hypothetical protein